MATAEVRLVYFDIRGLAEPVRWMMKISGVEFVDERIPLDAWSTSKRRTDVITKHRKSSAGEQKGEAIKMRMVGQLPILFFNDVILTQPLAVMRFLAKKLGFNGDSDLEEARAEEVSDLIYDLRVRATEYEGKCYRSKTPDIKRHTVFRDFSNSPDTKDKEKMRDDFRTIWLPLYFSKFNYILEQSGGQWIAGEHMTYGDLVVVNFLDIATDLMDPTCLEEFPKLKELMDRVFNIPEIKASREKPASGANGLLSV